FSLVCTWQPANCTLFPYSPLFRSVPHLLVHELLHFDERAAGHLLEVGEVEAQPIGRNERALLPNVGAEHLAQAGMEHVRAGVVADRKSTRLNSSHVKISYAVFCLK